MSDSEQVIRIHLERGWAELDTKSAVLRFVNSAGECYYDFKLSANIEYMSGENLEFPIEFVCEQGGAHFVFRGRDCFSTKEIHLEVKNCSVDYWVLAEPIEKPVEIKCVHYGQDAPGHENASIHRLEEFFILCPDRYGSCIPKTDKICFKLGVPSFRFSKDNNFPHEGGRTIIAPYVAALRSADEWLGVGTMEIPTSEYGLNMTFQDSRAVIDFYYGGNLKFDGKFAFPKITFFTNQDKLTTVSRYIERLYSEGLAVRNEQWDSGWAGPIYCFFSDQMYEYQSDRSTQEFAGEMTMTDNYCNDAFLDRCLTFLCERAIPYGMIIIDYGWFVTNGQWTPNTKRFKNFKETIKKLQAMGKKVLIWYSPYFISEDSEHYREHPEIVVKKRDGTPFFVVRFGKEINYQSDFTHPAMRELVRKDFEFILGPKGLNADGIKIDCTHQPPTIDNVFSDPSWGTGEMFHYKSSKFMYDTAKDIKPNCCINTTAGNPFFNRTYDLHRIHDGFEYNLDAYEERAWAAWVCGVGISDLDDWPSYDLFTVRANLRKIAYGIPSLYAASKRGVQRKTKCTWGYALSTSDDELDLLAGIYELYCRVPGSPYQEIFIDPFGKIFHRKYTSGKLEGFYAATTLSGNQAVAVYDEDGAYLISISDVGIYAPLPPGATNVKLSVVDRNDREREIEDFELIDDGIVLAAKRCCGEIKCYKIAYRI